MDVNIKSTPGNQKFLRKNIDNKSLIGFYGYSNKDLKPLLDIINSRSDIIFINYKNSILGTGGVGTVTRDMNDSLPHLRMVCYEHEENALESKHKKRIFTVDLSLKEKEAFHSSYAKLYLWPILHGLNTSLSNKDVMALRITVDNASLKFGKRALDASKDCSKTPIYWVNDYVLISSVGYLRRLSPEAKIIFSWRTTFGVNSPPKLYSQDAYKIVDNLSKADLVTFHTYNDLANFVALAKDYLLDLNIHYDENKAIFIGDNNRICRLRVVPLGSNPTLRKKFAKSAIAERARKELLSVKTEASQKIITSVSRFEISKGLVYELEIIDELFKSFPEMIGKVIFVRYSYISESKKDSNEYIELLDYVINKANEINIKYSNKDWAPVHFDLYRKLTDKEISGIYRATDILLVASLADGFNHISLEGPLSKIVDKDGPLSLILGNVGSRNYIQGYQALTMYDPVTDARLLYGTIIENPEVVIRKFKLMLRGIYKLSTHIWFTSILYSMIEPEQVPEIVINEDTK